MRYSGTWSSVKQENICGVTYYLMESDLFGEDMYHIIMNDSGAYVMTSEDGFNPLYEKINGRPNDFKTLDKCLNSLVS